MTPKRTRMEYLAEQARRHAALRQARELEVLEYLSEHPESTLPAIADHLRVRVETARRLLAAMETAGDVRCWLESHADKVARRGPPTGRRVLRFSLEWNGL